MQNVTTTLNFMQVVAMGADAEGLTAVHPTHGKGKVTLVKNLGGLVMVHMVIKGELVVDCGTQIMTQVR